MSPRSPLRHVAMVYAEVMEPDGLNAAFKIERIEQWEYRLPLRSDNQARGSIRVARIEHDGRVSYRETIWKPEPLGAPPGEYREFSVAITETYFDAWASLFGNLKETSHAHHFTLEGVVIRVGSESIILPNVHYVAYVYPEAKDGHTWCKITADLIPVYAFLKKAYPEAAGFDDQALFDALPFKPRRLLPFQSKMLRTKQ